MNFNQDISKGALLRLFTVAPPAELVGWGRGVRGGRESGGDKELGYQLTRSTATTPFLRETKYTASYSCPYKQQFSR